MALSTSSNFAKPDDAFRAIVEAHRGLSDEQSADLDAALVLVLANHIGDLDVLREAIALAKRRMLDAEPAAATAATITTRTKTRNRIDGQGFCVHHRHGGEEDHLLRDRHRSLCLHRRGRSELRRHRRRRRLPGVRRAGDAGDGQQGDRAGAHRHRQADQICRAVALSRGARARRFRLQGAGHRRLAGNLSAGRGARPAGLGFRIRPLPAPVPGRRRAFPA